MGPAGGTREILRYHAESTHHVHRFAPGPGRLDWANQPEPFRSYEGAEVLPLPLAEESDAPSWDALHRPREGAARPLDRAALGAFLELSLGLTAWKQLGASRWALRANPSSGNLHPTEGYVLVPDVPGVPAGLHHYLSRDHVLEGRLTPTPAAAAALARLLPPGGFVFGLSSIHWREAWKYGLRAFRYCQHDAGHALAAARYAAATLGWTARVLDAPGDDDVARVLGLDREEDFPGLAPEDREHPDALVLVAPPGDVDRHARRLEAALDELTALAGDGEWSGRPNPLSPEHVEWPEVGAVAGAAYKPRTPAAGEESSAPLSAAAVDPHGTADPGEGPASRPRPEGSAGGRPRPDDVSTARLVRQRRSAVAMDGRTSLPASIFFHMMERLLPRPGQLPWDALPWSPRVHPVLFVHRVDEVPPGLYVLERHPSARDALRRALRPGFAWTRPPEVPAALPLFLLEAGDTRSFAGLASCRQEIASESAFSLGMLSAFESSLEEGPWWYRRLFWETGVVGQVLYLEAEAAGVRATGIGCYFDDVVHEVLGICGPTFRDLYHFTVGGAVDDPRLTTLPAYPQEVRARA